jgi:hypothetical protein
MTDTSKLHPVWKQYFDRKNGKQSDDDQTSARRVISPTEFSQNTMLEAARRIANAYKSRFSAHS